MPALRHKLEITDRNKLSFYSLRHTVLHIAEETRDFPAVQLVMGHCDNSMAGQYRDHVSDDLLEAEADHVLRRHFGAATLS
jgi:integrase